MWLLSWFHRAMEIAQRRFHPKVPMSITSNPALNGTGRHAARISRASARPASKLDPLGAACDVSKYEWRSVSVGFDRHQMTARRRWTETHHVNA
jgi:hypothetical protein